MFAMGSKRGLMLFPILGLLLTLWFECSARTVEFTVSATADLHGNSSRFRRYIVPRLDELRKADPEMIYVDIGDTVQGSLPLALSRGHGMLTQLSAAGCRFFMPGNHELEYGFVRFAGLLGEFSGTVLGCNWESAELSGRIKALEIVEIRGVKIAFIGLMLPGMEKNYPLQENVFRTLPGKSALRRSVDMALAADVDVIILLRHAGIYGGGENLSALLKNIPEVDLVIGAHTHRAEPGRRVGSAWYVQPPANGTGLAECTFYFDTERRRIQQIESRISCFAPGENDENESVPETLPAPGAGKTPDFFARKIRGKMHSDLAVCYGASIESWQKLQDKSEPTLGDYYRAFPYFDLLVTVEVDFNEARQIVSELYDFAAGRNLPVSVSGFTAVVLNGRLEKFVPDKQLGKYKLSLSAYLAAGAGGRMPETRRILSGRIVLSELENAPGILEVLTEK